MVKCPGWKWKPDGEPAATGTRRRFALRRWLLLATGLLMSQSGLALFSQQMALAQHAPPAGQTDPRELLREARQKRETALFVDELVTAERKCREALGQFSQADDQAGEARALDELGRIALRRGLASEALGLFNRAIDAARGAGDQLGEARAVEQKGWVYEASNQHQQAVGGLQQALALYQQTGSSSEELNALLALGRLYQEGGQAEQAAGQYRQALTLARQAEDAQLEAKALGRLTWISRDLGQDQQAQRYAARARGIYRQIGDRLGEGYALACLAEVAWQMQQPERALRLYQQALATARELSAVALEWSVQARLANLYRQQDQTDKALSAFEAAVKIIESVPIELLTDERHRAIRMGTHDLFRHYANFLLGEGSTPAGLARAFIFSEQAHLRLLPDWLAETRLPMHHGGGRLQMEREQDILRRMRQAERELQSPALTETERQSAQQELSQAEEQLGSFRSDIWHNQPRYAALRYPRVPAVSQLRQHLLDSNSALLEYLLGEKRSFLLLLTADELKVYQLPAAEQIQHAVKTYSRFLAQPSSERDPLDMGQQLYRMLISPAGEELAGKTQLLIVPDGWLHYLPFEALIQEPKGSGGKRRAGRSMLEDYTISYAPSASLLVRLRQQAGQQGAVDQPLLVIGDRAQAQASSPEGIPLSPALQGLDREVSGIQQAVGAHYTDVWLPSSTGDGVLQGARLNRYHLLHFANRSVVDESRPERSGVELLVALESGADQMLRVPTIFNLRLNAQLVLLSHCQPQLSESTDGSGLISLTGSVFTAGAPAMVMSLWDIDGPSTGEFMKAFYQALRAGQSKRAALRSAKLKLLGTKSYQHPAYWARFVLIGDGAGAVPIASTAQTVVMVSALLVSLVLVMLGTIGRRRGMTD